MSFAPIPANPGYLTPIVDTVMIDGLPPPDIAPFPLASMIRGYVTQDSLPSILGLALYNAPINAPPYRGELDWQTEGGGGGPGGDTRPTEGLVYPRRNC